MSSSTYVALLRGINVGGHKIVPMAALRNSFEALGLKNVRTYVQSGNVVFSAPAQSTEALTQKLEQRIQRDFGFPVTVVLRTPKEFDRLVKGNPFLKRKGIDRSRLHVAFLSSAPAKSALAALASLAISPDEYHMAGCDVLLHYPDGAGKSKLPNNLLEKVLSVSATTRNWNTVTKLYEMSSGSA